MGNFDSRHFPLAIEGEAQGREVKLILP
jgi:hypothetical protein